MKLHTLQMLCSSPNLKSSIFTLDEKYRENKHGIWKTLYKLNLNLKQEAKNSHHFQPATYNERPRILSLIKAHKTCSVGTVTGANPASFMQENICTKQALPCQIMVLLPQVAHCIRASCLEETKVSKPGHYTNYKIK